MAALQERGGSYRVIFRYNGKQHAFTLGTVSKGEAETKSAQVDYILMRLKQKLIALPDGVDIVRFLQFDGKPPDVQTIPDAPRQVVTLAHLKDRFLDTYGNGTIEANSLDTCRIHLTHLCRLLGDKFPVADLSTSALQDYVNRRAKAKISPVTIRKELATLRAAWNWGATAKLTQGKFPNVGLRFAKRDEKPPFMTHAEITRQIDGGGDPGVLWDALYLQTAELTELLDLVKSRDSHGWIYPLFVFAAHTGARRSEILRATVADVDFGGNAVTIREKKRSRGERTRRRVPLTPLLRSVLEAWLKDHPGCPHLFCHRGEVLRSKKRSRTTGHRGEGSRPTTLKGRMEAVSKRQQPGLMPLTRSEVHHHFKAVLKDSKWSVIRGLHCLRHSFISASASKGVDQRFIDEWTGHSTEEQRKRYRHLWPSSQEEAIKRVFE